MKGPPVTVDRLYRARPWIAAGLGLSVVLALFGAARIGMNFTPQRAFESDDEGYAYLERLQETFGRDDDVLLIHVRAPDGVFAPEPIDFLRRLRAALLEVDGVERVEDVTSAWVFRPNTMAPTPLVPPGGDLGEARAQALAQPLVAGRLVSEDARAALVVVELDAARMGFDDLSPLVHAALDAIDGVAAPAEVEALPTGIPVARVFIVEGLISDQLTFLPVCSVLFFLVLWLVFRDLRAVVFPLVGVFAAIVLTTGLLGATGEDIDIINNVIPTLIFVIGISDAIHLISRYRRELSSGEPQRSALWSAVRHLAVACFLTSVTTAAGFASLLIAEISILQRFGLYAAGGVLIAYVVTIVLVPLAFSYTRPVTGGGGERIDRLLDRVAGALGGLAIRRRRAVAAGGILFAAGAAWLASGVEEENSLYESFQADDPLVVANGRIEEDFSGVIPMSLVFEWDAGTDVLTPEALGYVAELQAFLEARQRVGGSLSPVDALREWNAARHFGDPAARRLPETAAELERGIASIRELLAARGRADVVDRVYAPEAGMMRISALIAATDSTVLQGEVLPPIAERLAADAERQRALGLRVRLSGDGPVASRGVTRLILDLFESLLLAFGIIFVVMCLLLRSFLAALVSMLPNVFPLLVTLGFMGLVGMDLRVTSVIVFTVSLGLAVDDTIHFMARFREEWRHELTHGAAGRDPYAAAIERTFVGTGAAILATSVLLAAGFSVLLLSRFPITQTFALCLVITVLAAIVGDLLLLPACLAVLRPFRAATGRGREDPSEPGPEEEAR